MNNKQKNNAIPGDISTELQEIVDILAELPGVSAAVILKLDSPQLEVLCTGGAAGSPFKTGDRVPAGGPALARDIDHRKKTSAYRRSERKKCRREPRYPGIVSCLSDVPLYPDGKIFGIICVMASKKRTFNPLNKKLITHFKKEIDALLEHLYAEKEEEKDKIVFNNAEEKLASVGILAGGIAQDFNSLLSVIIGNISLARMEVPPGEKVYDLLLESEKASCQAADIAEKLITFSEGGWLVRREERVPTILREVTKSNSLASRVSFNIQLPHTLSTIFADEGQFKQVVSNVFHNAADAMPEGGEVKVTAADITVEPGDELPLQPGQYVKLTIQDRGSGIPEKHLNKIFDPYFSTKDILSKQGMGLGLSICYSIMKKHEGWIDVESKEGSGTTVHLYVPIYTEEIEKKALNV